PGADVNAVAVGQRGLLAVPEQVVAVVEAGAVGRPQVGDRQPGVLELQDGVLCGDAAVDRMDTEVDAGIDALPAVASPDQCVVVQPDSAFGEDFREVHGVGTAAGDDALVVLLIRRNDGGPFDLWFSG